MFGIDFSEITLVAVIALLVLGPERLPRVARTAGALLRRARSGWQNVRSEIERELAAEDLKKTVHDLRAAADLRGEMNAAATDIDASVRSAASPPNPARPDERS